MLRKMLKRLVQKPRVTSIRITGHIVLKQPGRPDVITKPNHMVNNTLNAILTFMGHSYSAYNQYIAGVSNSFVIGFGSDLVQATLATMTVLSNTVSNKSDTRTLVGVTKEAEGQYRCVWRAMWNANHFDINKILGEIGLFLNASPPGSEEGAPTKASSDYPATYFSGLLVSRVCVADGDFTLYTVDFTKPLTIEYWIRLTMV